MPCTLVSRFVVTPVATFVMEIVALKMAAPDSSLTVPERLPPTTCAYPGMDARNQSVNTTRGIQPTKKLSNLVRALMIFVILISPLTEVACTERNYGCRSRRLLESGRDAVFVRKEDPPRPYPL